MSDLLGERVVIVAATQGLTLSEAADFVADELTRDEPWTPLTIDNVTHVDFRPRGLSDGLA
jgi:hypothetical protein